jgi:AP2-associated kinase
MNTLHMPPAPQGTILPGTTIQLGRFTVVVDRYIAEGGFAHVYVGSILNNGAIVPGFPVVIKRIAVADKERLAVVNAEIETMVIGWREDWGVGCSFHPLVAIIS